jgi:hypothetical protein
VEEVGLSELEAAGAAEVDFKAFHRFHSLATQGTTGATLENQLYYSAFHPRIDSQDAWVFRAPMPEAIVREAGFELGRPRWVCLRPLLEPLG